MDALQIAPSPGGGFQEWRVRPGSRSLPMKRAVVHPPGGKGSGRVLAAAPTLPCRLLSLGLSFPSQLMGVIPLTLWVLVGKQETDVWNGSEKRQGSVQGLQPMCLVLFPFLFPIVGLESLKQCEGTRVGDEG